ncbi:MAG: DUF401 family protein [Nitrososphaerota archaeon]
MALLSSPYALLISVTLIIVLVFRKINIALSLLVGAILYGALTLDQSMVKATVDSFNLQMIQTVVALMLSMFLADLYSSTSVSKSLVEGLEGLGPRFAAFATPSVIGLLPMPGGAYISAVIVDPLYQEMNLKPDVKTFINYWFRHIWITTWPLYQGVILASGILGIPAGHVTIMNIPITLAATISGIIVCYREIRSWRSINVGEKKIEKIIHVWPFIAIALLTLVLKVNLVVAIFATILIFMLIYKPGLKNMVSGLRYMFNPTFIGIVVFSFIFSKYIEESNVALSLKELLGPYAELAIFTIPLALVIGTGVEFTYIALAFPPLLPLLQSEDRLILGFLGGFTGAMVSPAHACLVLSANYYKTELTKPYKLIIPASILTITLTILYITLT